VFRRKVLMKHFHEIKGQKGFVRIFLLPLKVSATNEKKHLLFVIIAISDIFFTEEG
jgi:hypothetical protein